MSFIESDIDMTREAAEIIRLFQQSNCKHHLYQADLMGGTDDDSLRGHVGAESLRSSGRLPTPLPQIGVSISMFPNFLNQTSAHITKAVFSVFLAVFFVLNLSLHFEKKIINFGCLPNRI